MSLLTLGIRLCNVKKDISVWETTPTNDKDGSLWKKVKDTKLFDALPDKVANKYIWYVSEEFNSKKTKDFSPNTISMIHNNGVLSWAKQVYWYD